METVSLNNDSASPIRFLNRYTGQVERETVYGEGFLRWTYLTVTGRLALQLLAKRALFSRWYGWRMKRPGSRSKIGPFIKNYQINPEEFETPVEGFKSFNDFFIRKLRPQARPIASDSDAVVFPADGRHLGFPVLGRQDGVFVKGQQWDLVGLLGDATLAEHYQGGTLVLSRLCPVDYHRFHFPCEGIPDSAHPIPGPLFSVSPIALRNHLEYLWQNKRVRTRVTCDLLGEYLTIEVGATCVGGIVQTYVPGRLQPKGGEKGYFEFGGSSTITLFPPGRVELSEDLVESTRKGIELYARMGDRMGRVVR